MRSKPLRPDRLLLVFGLVLTVCVYWPGLRGGYFFDDYPNIVDNSDVHVTTSDVSDWRAAAMASPSAELRRPLAMLSFAGNYYFTGLDPFPMKLTNLFIHLLNGGLLWKVLVNLFGMWRIARPAALTEGTARITAAGIAFAWLLLPINLSSVLYVVQRMEILAQTFVLAGIWLYLAGRKLILAGRGSAGLATCAAGIVLGSGVGSLCKESAVLLPVYAFLIEFLLLRFDAPNQVMRRGLWLLFGALLLAPAVFGLGRVVPWVTSATAYAGRPFTLDERLLTEARVLVDYVIWTFTPDAGVQSFYHDDLPPSHGWLDPASTLICALLLAAALAAAVVARRKLPLVSLGICWYFAAHLLTATIIPLELVFEHRNYCATIGPLMVVAAMLHALARRSAFLGLALPVLLVAALAFTTFQRANEWSDPLRLAYSEALKHPLSPRANYELGRALTVASGYRQNSRLIAPAIEAFDRASRLPNGGPAPVAAMIVVAGHMHQAVQPDWWPRLDQAMAAHPPSAEAVSALESLVGCQHHGDCPQDIESLLGAFMSALTHPPSGRLLAAYGAFAANELGDYALAQQLFSDALLRMPLAEGVRLDLVQVLLLEGKRDQARDVLAGLRGQALSSASASRAKELEAVLVPDAGKDLLRKSR